MGDPLPKIKLKVYFILAPYLPSEALTFVLQGRVGSASTVETSRSSFEDPPSLMQRSTPRESDRNESGRQSPSVA